MIALRIIPEYDDLCCPHCGHDTCLHHEEIEVFARFEDRVPIELTIDAVTAAISHGCVSSNPSSRRQGIVVYFRCEKCQCTPRLSIAQHKGATLVGWIEPLEFDEKRIKRWDNRLRLK